MYSRKKPIEELPQEETAIWQCVSDDCIGWMRDDFSFEEVPTCYLCSSPMVSATRMLPALVNTTKMRKI